VRAGARRPLKFEVEDEDDKTELEIDLGWSSGALQPSSSIS
jgi:hypothetical protein